MKFDPRWVTGFVTSSQCDKSQHYPNNHLSEFSSQFI
jgi:hypothetical protein